MKLFMTTDPIGGVWTYTLELVKELSRRGIDVMVASMGAPLRPAQRQQFDVIANVQLVEGLHKLEWMDNPWESVNQAGKWLLELSYAFRPDVVHLNQYAHAALNWNAPTLVVAHSCVLSWWRAVKRQSAPRRYDTYMARVKHALSVARAVVAPTKAMMEEIVTLYDPPGQLRVIANSRDHAAFAALAKEPVILAAGRIWDEAKNIAALCKAADGTLWPVAIAGEHGAAKCGTRHPSNLKLLGQLDEPQLAEWFGRASIYALPAKYEPFGLSVLEAALSGCALVLGDIPSLRENWEGAAAFVSPDNVKTLRGVLNNLIQNPDQRSELAHRARQRALMFKPSRMAMDYIGLYHHLGRWTNKPRLAEAIDALTLDVRITGEHF